ncbi:MAG: carboxypeptidase regulatory-like domain-containing protein [Acidobacteriaceae bacterium]
MTRLVQYMARCLLIAGVFALPYRAMAQGIITGNIVGTVADPTGAVVPGATITATEVAKGSSVTTQSLGNGTFSFRDMPTGTYNIRVAASGFVPYSLTGVLLTVGNTVDLHSVTLKVGTSVQAITVSDLNQVQLNTTNSQVSSVFSPLELQQLPLANAFDTVALLTPGTARTLMNNFSDSNGAPFSSNGQRGRANNFEIDGQANNDNSVTGPAIEFGNQDALSGIQVITNQFGAQYGRNMGSVVNYQTKNGTNQLHGSVFEFFTGSWLSSLSQQYKSPVFGFCPPGVSPSTGCSPITNPKLVDNRWGATLGGPVLRNRLWFFGSGYWDHTNTGTIPSTSGTLFTPTPAGISDLAGSFPGSPAVGVLKNYGPYSITTGNPTPVASQASMVPVTLPGGAAATIPVAPISRTVASPFRDAEYMGRLDFQPDNADRFFGRFYYQSQSYAALGAGSSDENVAQGAWFDIPVSNYLIAGNWTRTFSPRWVNSLTYGFQQEKVFFEGGALPNCVSTNFTACTASLAFNGTENDLPFGYAANIPDGRTVKVTQVQDNATFSTGRNTILFGGEIDYQNSPNVFLPFYNGQYSFGSLSTLLNDSASNITLANGSPVIPFTELDYFSYVQDDWKLREDLTVNLGLRWEVFGMAINKLHTSTLAQQTGSNPFWNTALPLSLTTVPNVPTPYKNFEPRLGFNWNPAVWNHKLSVQGGFAINFDEIFYNPFLNVASNAPAVFAATYTPSGPSLPVNGQFSGAAVRAAQLPHLPTGGDPGFDNIDSVSSNFHNPYTESYRLGIQYQLNPTSLITLSYNGNHQVGNFQNINANPNLAPVAAVFPNIVNPASLCSTPNTPGTYDPTGGLQPAARPDCSRSIVNTTTNTAFALYNSAQVQFQKRTTKGLTFVANYTYSRTIDNTSEIFSTGGGGNTLAYAQNPLDIDQGERALSGISLTHVVAVDLVYELPFYQNQSNLLHRLLGGFTTSAIWTANSGEPYTAFQPSTLTNPVTGATETSFCDLGFDFAEIGADNCRLVLSNPKAPQSSVAYNAGPGNGYVAYGTTTPINPANARWIVNNENEAIARGNPYPGSSRNILRGDMFNELDASLYKQTHLSHGMVLTLQMNVYNVTNYNFLNVPQPSLSAYSTTGAQGFLTNTFNSSNGTSYSSQGNRQVQLEGHIVF